MWHLKLGHPAPLVLRTAQSSLPTSILSAASFTNTSAVLSSPPSSSDHGTLQNAPSSNVPAAPLNDIPAHPFCVDLSPNVESPVQPVHPMVTRLKSGALKPRSYPSACQAAKIPPTVSEPKTIAEALASPHWGYATRSR
ncbi:hypothetical protein LWI29_033026 [Acer saccharum]|uniref:Uncharacterized protein n=1 Tax=Acer saccharum TaxID=4024 RepID=A0AA39T7W1_ACESA|nr:hypothetical protein LWI29_033026 [Acer saccharum]